MGKAISHSTKVKAKILLKHYPGMFSSDFTKTKGILQGLKVPISKKTLNLVSAFISRALKKQENA